MMKYILFLPKIPALLDQLTSEFTGDKGCEIDNFYVDHVDST
jgi:hypothetical protein